MVRLAPVDTIEGVYHRVLVYGSQEILDIASAYNMSDAVRRRICYCGYVSRASTPGPIAEPREVALPSTPFALGAAGGGEDGVEVLSATLRAARQLGTESVLVTGPLMPAARRVELEIEAAADGRAQVVEFVTDLSAYGVGRGLPSSLHAVIWAPITWSVDATGALPDAVTEVNHR